MNIVSAIVVFVVLWWLVFFMVLPWGVRRLDAPEPGQEFGAPERPMLWRKALITAVIATILFGITYAIVTSDLLPLREMFKPKL
jgi:predicted secreted protein